MTGLLDWLKSLYTVGVQYICWLGLATLVFSHSLEKRKMACLKGSAATAGFLLLGMLASSTAVDGALPVVWYFVLPLVNMLVIMSYCQISWREAFQCALLASLTEHLANSVYILIFVSNAPHIQERIPHSSKGGIDAYFGALGNLFETQIFEKPHSDNFLLRLG